MIYSATLTPVFNRGIPPVDFLDALLNFGRSADPAIFAPNAAHDIYSSVEPYLGPWTVQNRPAALLEVLRVIAGFESSWNWNQGVDTSNPASMANINQQETGIFQVSYDSVHLERNASTLLDCVERYIPQWKFFGGQQLFIDSMKSNHAFAIEYCARLFRINIDWSGPTIGRHMQPWLSKAAMAEFQSLW